MCSGAGDSTLAYKAWDFLMIISAFSTYTYQFDFQLLQHMMPLKLYLLVGLKLLTSRKTVVKGTKQKTKWHQSPTLKQREFLSNLWFAE